MLTDLGNPQGIPLQGLGLRKIPGVPDPSPDPDLNLDLDPEEVLGGIIRGHGLDHALIDVPGAGLIVEITVDGTATVILPCQLGGVMLGIGQILTPTVVLECLD